MRAFRCGRAAVCAALALALGSGAIAGAQAGVTALDPAFRLPAGGRALAGPIVDSSISPPAAWLLSEDLSLYALTDQGKLAARIDLASKKPGGLLALDPFGRVLVTQGAAASAVELVAYTRMGSAAWRVPIAAPPPAAASFAPAFGSDGRAFVLSGGDLVCLSPSGLRLWSLALPAAVSCPPGVDGRGYPCTCLADGRLIVASPYGAIEVEANLGSPAVALCALPRTVVSGAAGTELLAGASLAAGLADGRLLFIDLGGGIVGEYRAKASMAALAWGGERLYGLDASGEAFAIAVTGAKAGTELGAAPTAAPAQMAVPALWSTPTGCAKGGLCLFGDRLVVVGKAKAASLSLGGEIFRELSVPGGVGLPAISPAGLAYASGSDWVLAAYRFEKPLGLPVSPALRPYSGLPDVVSRELSFDPFAAYPDRQLARLTDIHNSLRSGTIGVREPELAAYCAAVIERSLERELAEEERRHGGSSLARARACELLGELGSVAYREPLFEAACGDPDPSVRAAACDALAEIMVDPDGRSMAAFLAAASRPVDERTAFAIVDAIEGMCLRSGRAPSGDALRALVRLTTRPYGQAVRSRAMAALGRISGTSR
jgi:hypothetical protein